MKNTFFFWVGEGGEGKIFLPTKKTKSSLICNFVFFNFASCPSSLSSSVRLPKKPRHLLGCTCLLSRNYLPKLENRLRRLKSLPPHPPFSPCRDTTLYHPPRQTFLNPPPMSQIHFHVFLFMRSIHLFKFCIYVVIATEFFLFSWSHVEDVC